MSSKKSVCYISNTYAYYMIVMAIVLVTSIGLQSCIYYRTALEGEYRIQADQAYEKKEYKKALEYYQKISKVTLNNTARYRIAELQIHLKEYDIARRAIDRLLRRDKKNLLVQELDAYWHFSTGDIAVAISKYETLLSIEPFNTRILNNLGIIYQQQQEYEKALDYFNRTLKSHEHLSLSALKSYVEVINRLDTELDETKEVHLAEILNYFVQSLNDETIGIHELNEVAQVIENIKIEFSYPIYKLIANQSIQLDEEEDNTESSDTRRVIANANFTLAEMILGKSYVPLDVEPLSLALSHLESALALGYGGSIDELNNLYHVSDNYLDTNVMKVRVATMYRESGLISAEDFARRLEDAKEEVQESSSETEEKN